MPTPNPTDQPQDTAAAIAALTAALQRFEARYEAARRAERRLRLGLFLAGLALLGGTLSLASASTTNFLARIAPPRIAESDPEAARLRRERLLASLPAEERERLLRFEAEARLVREYLDVSPDFDSGATVALMLSSMSGSVAVMPQLYGAVAAMAGDMRAISTRMEDMDRKMDALPALPALAAEIQGMRGQMAVMAAGVDATMGRAGRMLPWNW
jgi:hypothetical protein